MRTRLNITQLGLGKLAEMANMPLESLQSYPAPPKPLRIGEDVRGAIKTLYTAPTPHEINQMNAYTRAGLVGGITGSAISTLLAALLKRPALPALGVGAGAGLLAGVLRQYDQSSDPPGLSPVYTIPAGLRLGALTGGISGGALGHLTGAGVVPGAIGGALAGGISGGVVSNFV